MRLSSSRSLIALIAAIALPLSLASTVSTAPAGASAGTTRTPPGPYSCGEQANMTVSGTFGDAGLIGWAGDKDGVVACLGGSFYVRDGKKATYGYGVYDNASTTWTNADGYLPALVTTFHRAGTRIEITNFGDQVTVGGHRYVAVYSRVAVHNPTSQPVTIQPYATPGLIPLTPAPNRVPAGGTVHHDYVVAADRFGNSYAWPSDSALKAAGGFAKHFAHMKSYWNRQLKQIANVAQLPDRTLVNAYKAGYIYTQIIRDGSHLNTGENGYDSEFSHDVVGILANLLVQGDFSQAKCADDAGAGGRGCPEPVRRRRVEVPVAVGGVRPEDRGRRVRQGELRHERTDRRERAEHRGHRSPDREGPHRAGRHHAGDQRHRRQRLLDDRRLLGTVRPGGVPVRGREGRRRRVRSAGRPGSTTAC